MEDVCNGLIFIHDEKGLVHLDIKPENVCDHLLVLRTVRSLSSNPAGLTTHAAWAWSHFRCI